MGIKLSSSGGLTFSQKKAKNVKQQSELLGKLSKMEINKPILAEVERIKQEKRVEAQKRADARASAKVPRKSGRYR